MDRLEAFAQIAAQAGRGELIFPSSVNGALKLQLALDDPECHIGDAVKLVLAEPLLAARTVALANSALFKQGGAPITSVRSAILRVGYGTLQALVAGLVVRQLGSRIVDPPLRSKFDRQWEHTAHVAALAQLIAREVTGVHPETALFAGIVHEVGGFYLLSRAGEYPGLLDDDPEHWVAAGEEIVTREVMRKLRIPAPVSEAIEALRDGWLSMPPESLLDTLLLANHFSPVASALAPPASVTQEQSEAIIDFVIDHQTLEALLQESAEEVRSISAALMA